MKRASRWPSEVGRATGYPGHLLAGRGSSTKPTSATTNSVASFATPTPRRPNLAPRTSTCCTSTASRPPSPTTIAGRALFTDCERASIRCSRSLRPGLVLQKLMLEDGHAPRRPPVRPRHGRRAVESGVADEPAGQLPLHPLSGRRFPRPVALVEPLAPPPAPQASAMSLARRKALAADCGQLRSNLEQDFRLFHLCRLAANLRQIPVSIVLDGRGTVLSPCPSEVASSEKLS